jgi:hypothetical protein
MAAVRRTSGPLLAALLIVATVAGAARAADPARVALQHQDAYVSPIVMRGQTATARATLAKAARRLRGKGRPVKLAIVAGPAGARTMLTYARRLRVALDFDGTLVVTAPRRTVVAVGPLPPATVTRALRSVHANRVMNPVQRVIRAAEVATPEPALGTSAWIKGLAALIGLAALGGAWAAAWGIRRERRHARNALADARALMLVRLDALRARTLALGARPGLSEAARVHLRAALSAHADAMLESERATTPAEVRRARERLAEGLAETAAAARMLGERVDPDAPYAGLCEIDPAHGPATARATARGADAPLACCDACAAAAERGDAPSRRMVSVAGRPVPFDEAPADD